MASKEYNVRVSRVEPDYDQDAGYRVDVYKPGFPPHSSKFFTDKKAAQAYARKLRKSLP